MLSSATLTLNMRIILSDPFPDLYSYYLICVCNHCRWTNKNRCSVMGMTSHLSWISDAFSSYRVSFSLMMSLTIMGLGQGRLVRALFTFCFGKIMKCPCNSVGRVSGVGSGVFGRLIEIFSRLKS